MNKTQEPNSLLAHAGFRIGQLCLGLTCLALAACGGGGGGSSQNNGLGSGNAIAGTTTSTVWTAGAYAPSATYAAKCAAPRTGIDPTTGASYVDTAGSTSLENFWLRSWTHELYLWYREVPDLDPGAYSSTSAYFNLMKTAALTPSGKAKDRFHFTYPTATWIAMSQSGVTSGYGAEWSFIANTPPRKVVVAYTDPNSPAVTAGLSRGVEVLSIDGVDLVNDNTASGIAVLNEGLYPSAAGGAHTFVVRDLNGTQRSLSMTSANVTSAPVQNVTTLPTSAGAVGYMLFNDHIATAEQALIAAFTQLKNANVNDLVLDIRYNGGGYLALASEVAYMVAGPTLTSGKTFERTTFNDQYTTTDPVTGKAITPMPFLSTAQGFSTPSGTALPTLNLNRVFVLTGGATCSASESIINGLRGAGVNVIQIGSTTCGKPYGFYPEDNCGTTYFSIQFKGVNQLGFGDYTDGFSPANTASNRGEILPGCSVADDFTHALGNASEGRLAAALSYRTTSTCSVPASGSSERMQIQSLQATEGEDLSNVDGVLYKGAWRENRILER